MIKFSTSNSEFMPRQGLSYRLLFFIIICNFLFAIFTSGFSLYQEYQTDREQILENIDNIYTSFGQSVAVSVWNLNEAQIAVQIDGILDFPDIQYVRIRETIENVNIVLSEVGVEPIDNSFGRSFTLEYQGAEVGQLEIFASLDGVYARLIDKIIYAVSSQIIISLLLSIIILGLFHQVVIRHIVKMVDYIRTASPDGSEKPLVLDGRADRKRNNELDVLADSFNFARAKTISEFNARQLVNEKLAYERDFSKTVISYSNTIICCLNSDLTIDSTNAAGSEISGLAVDNIIGKDWLSIFVEEDKTEQLSLVLKKYESIESIELQLNDSTGKNNTLIWSFAPFYDSGTIRFMIGFGNDVTELKTAELELTSLNNQLEEKVIKRTESLKETNTKLAVAFQDLKYAQQSLVETEKLASLGRLVAGVAHEINTPIGISVTVNSALEAEHKKIDSLMTEGKLTKNTLEHFISRVGEATVLMGRTLETASDLVQNFKQVSADQVSSKRRSFDLKTMVAELLATLAPTYKHHKLEQDIPEGINLDSYPGSLAQVVTNLTANALTHGYDNEERGEVFIGIGQLDEDKVQITFTDTGKGIHAANIDKIFEPFFTTRRGSGGTGLGLNIVHNIMTSILGGKIWMNSTEGEGTVFTIELPLIAPVFQEGKHDTDDAVPDMRVS
ncbi:MAG: PAS domain S-box protein [Oceanospirillaceae bacterium]|nr:PAS domain S-box protein [Oceanospirillaceae bacterium]